MPSLLEKHYQEQVAGQMKQAVLRFVLIAWASVLILNIIVLGAIYWTFKEGWLRTLDEQMTQDLLTTASTGAILTPEPAKAPSDGAKANCSNACLPGCR